MGPIQSAIATLNPQRVHIDCQLWFSHPSTGSHIDIGYTSSDQAIIQRQVESCKAVFAPAQIDFVADWYGDSYQPSSNACIALRKQSELSGTEFSICIDHGAIGSVVNPTEAFNSLLFYLIANFFHSSAYAKHKGRFLLWEFNLASIKGLDLAAWEASHPDVLLLHENRGVNSYAWPNGFAPNTPQEYLTNYLKHSFTSGLMIPCLWKGFDDHKKSDPTQSVWGGPARKMDSGPSGWNLWNSLTSIIQNSGKQFTDIGVATLDDYEERTRLEPFILQEWAGDVASQAQVLQSKAQQLTNVYDALLRAN